MLSGEFVRRGIAGSADSCPVEDELTTGDVIVVSEVEGHVSFALIISATREKVKQRSSTTSTKLIHIVNSLPVYPALPARAH
jgi:hypothetical protein